MIKKSICILLLLVAVAAVVVAAIYQQSSGSLLMQYIESRKQPDIQVVDTPDEGQSTDAPVEEVDE